MNKLKLFSSALLLLLGAGISKAQFGYIKPDDMDAIHSRTLVVVVEKPSDELTEKINKKHKGAGDAYSKAIDDFNKNFAAAVAQSWKISEGSADDIQYKSLDELNDISDKKNYVVLFCRSVAHEDLQAPYPAKNGIMWWPDYKEVAHDKDFSSKMTVMGIAFLDKFSKGAPVYQVPLPDLYPTKEDVKYGVNIINAYIMYMINHRKDNQKKLNEQMLQDNQSSLKDKTLLLPRDYTDKKITKAQMDKYYPYPYMIAGKDTIAKAIDSSDSRYAIAMVVPTDLESSATGGLEYVEIVYNAEDGSIYASSGVPGMPSDPKNASAGNANASKPLITKKALVDFGMYMKGGSSDEDDNGGKKEKSNRN